MFNQTPQKIIQTNRLPFIIGIFVLLFVMGIFMYKTQMNQKVAMVQSRPHQSMDVSPKGSEAAWFNDEKFKNIKFNNESLVRHETPEKIEANMISRQEIDVKKQEIEDEYATDLEIKKIQDRERIEEKNLS